MPTRLAILIAGLLVFLDAADVSGQTIILPKPAGESPVAGLRFMYPYLTEPVDLSLISGTYDLYLRAPLSKGFHFIADIPFCGFTSPQWDDLNWNGDIALGNIYVGARHRAGDTRRSASEMELGIWLPTANTEMPAVSFRGMLANYLEMQRHLPKSVTLCSNYARHWRGAGDQTGLARVQLGPELLLVTEGDYDSELFLHYGLSGGLCTPAVSFQVEVLGQFIVTEDPDKFADRFIHSLVLGIQATEAAVRPGLFLMLPLDDTLDAHLDSVLGCQVEFVLP